MLGSSGLLFDSRSIRLISLLASPAGSEPSLGHEAGQDGGKKDQKEIKMKAHDKLSTHPASDTTCIDFIYFSEM